MPSNRNSIEIARHAGRVRRYERKLQIRAKTRESVRRIQDCMEKYEAQARAMQNYDPMIQPYQKRWYESLLESENFTSKPEKLRLFIR